MNKKLAFIILVLICLDFFISGFLIGYKIGNDKGFSGGWDKGFIRGMENSEYKEIK